MLKTISHAVLVWSASVDGDNTYMDGRRECEEIRDNREILVWYSYIYIFFLSNLLIFLLNNVHYTIVYWVQIYLYPLCLIVCNVIWCVARANRNHSTIGTHTRSGHIKTALGIGLRTGPQLISLNPRYIFFLEYVSASRIPRLFLYPLLYVF